MTRNSFFAIIGAVVTIAAVVAGVLLYMKKHGKLHCCSYCDNADDDLMEYIEGDGEAQDKAPEAEQTAPQEPAAQE